MTFGVLIDADHLFAAPRYISDNGWDAILAPTWDDGSGHVWRSLFHEPVGFFVVAPLAVGWRFMVPLPFWGMHVFIDWFQKATIDQSALIESVIFILVVSGIIHVTYRRWKALRPGGSYSEYLAYASSYVKSLLPFQGGPARGSGDNT